VSETATKEITILNETKFLASVREGVREVVTLGRFPEGELNRLTLAVDEAVTNIMEHAYQHDLEGREKIEVSLAANDSEFTACVRDWGQSFSPLDVPAPNLEQHVKQGRKHGLGVFLIKQIMDEVSYTTNDEGRNELCMIKRTKRKKEGAPVAAARKGRRT
jgi:serine/threonine-protein kinase RsbW